MARILRRPATARLLAYAVSCSFGLFNRARVPPQGRIGRCVAPAGHLHEFAAQDGVDSG